MTTALITRATSGIGRKIVWQLAAERMSLILVARSADRLGEVAEHIRQIADVEVEALSTDLSQAEDAPCVHKRLTDDERSVGLFASNAGLGLDQDFVGGDIEHELSTLNVMVRTVPVTCHAIISNMVTRGGRGIPNTASTTALTAQGTYSVHKVWVCAFTEGLAASLKGTGVNATIICPSLVYTEFHEKVGVNPGQQPESVFIPAEGVVAKAIEGARRGKVVVTPLRRYRVFASTLEAALRSLVCAVAGPKRPDCRG